MSSAVELAQTVTSRTAY